MCICIGAHTTYKLASTLGLNFLVLPITYLGDPELFSLVFCDCFGTLEDDCSVGHVLWWLRGLMEKSVRISFATGGARRSCFKRYTKFQKYKY